MDTITKTNKHLNLFHVAGKAYVNSQVQKSKLTIAIEKVMRKTKHKLEQMAEDELDSREEFALTGEGGRIIYGADKNLVYDKEGSKKMRAALRELFNTPCEIPVHIVTEYDIKTLSLDFREIFQGIVIPEQDDALDVVLENEKEIEEETTDLPE